MNRIIVILLLASTFFWSCKKDTTSNQAEAVKSFLDDFKEDVSIGGYPYKHHFKNKGDKPKAGAKISYHQTIQIGDSIIFSTTKAGKPKEAIMPSPENYPSPPPPDYVALTIMSEGDSLSIFQPLSTIPVEKLPPNMSQSDTIVHHLKLLELKQADELKKEIAEIQAKEKDMDHLLAQFLDQYDSGALGPRMKKTKSGLEYIIIKKSIGDSPKIGQYIKVHYSGLIKESQKPFDNTYRDGRPYSFQFGTGRVIKGWDEGIAFLNEGEQAVFFIPYTLAYGAMGKPPQIPEKADLAFLVELVEVMN